MEQHEEITRVYRVENEYGGGPYRVGEVGNSAHRSISNDYTPGPFTDPDHSGWARDNSIRDYYFGFKSIDAYKRWFSDRKLLKEEGFHLAVYHVPASAVRHGTKQSLFVKEKAKLIERRSPVRPSTPLRDQI